MLSTILNSAGRCRGGLHAGLLAVALSGAVVAVGCGAAAGAKGNWERVTEHSSCEALPTANCSAAFGFSIDRSGNFTAGPSPTGKTVQGTITSQEMSQLNALASDFLATASQTLHCQTPQPPLVPGVGDRIQLSTDSGTDFDVWRLGGDVGVCFMGDATKSAALRDFYHQLLAKYYPNPFPIS